MKTTDFPLIVLVVALALFAAVDSPVCGMQIFVKEFTGRTTTLEVEPSDSIKDCKLQIRDKSGWLPNVQGLTYAGLSLEDDLTLADYSIRMESTLHLLMTTSTTSRDGPLLWAATDAWGVAIRDAEGTMGTGWSGLAIDGDLEITATSENPMLIKLYTVAGDSPGTLFNFDPDRAYSWTFVTVTGSISGFSPDKFLIDASGFQNPLGSGTFSVGEGSITLNYQPVPEPASALASAGLLSSGLLIRRRSSPVITGCLTRRQ